MSRKTFKISTYFFIEWDKSFSRMTTASKMALQSTSGQIVYHLKELLRDSSVASGEIVG